MKRALLASLFALTLTGTAAIAGGYADTIRQSYQAAGYSGIEVREVNGQWLVTADKAGKQYRYIVDAKTGQSTEVADGSPDAALFDGTGATGGLVIGGASSAVSGQNTGNASGGDDDSEHGEAGHSESEHGESGGESDQGSDD